MSVKHIVLLTLMAISFVGMVARGLAGSTKTYGAADVFGAMVEFPLWAWLAVTG